MQESNIFVMSLNHLEKQVFEHIYTKFLFSSQIQTTKKHFIAWGIRSKGKLKLSKELDMLFF